jgi:hypothetical protein
MKNVVIDAAGVTYVCGEDISPVIGLLPKTKSLKDEELKTYRDRFPACSGGWQYFQILRDNLGLKKARRRFLATVAIIIAAVWLLLAASTAQGGMMGDLPKAVPAVNYVSPQTYTIWSEKGMSLYAGLPEISVTTRGLHFSNAGQPMVLNLRPGEAVIISADPRIPGGPKLPQAPYQQRVGPRK